jgi:hypothetical protein
MTYDSAGAAVVYPASTTASTDGDLSSVASYDLTGSYALMRIVSTSGTGTDNFLRLGSGANWLRIIKEDSILYFQQLVAGAQTNVASVTFNATTHACWRIRESAGTTYWETSQDGMTWNVNFSAANPIAVTSLPVVIAGVAYTTATSPGTFKFNNFNVTPSASHHFTLLGVGA